MKYSKRIIFKNFKLMTMTVKWHVKIDFLLIKIFKWMFLKHIMFYIKSKLQSTTRVHFSHVDTIQHNQIRGGGGGLCLGIFIPLEKCSLIWRRLHYRWRPANVDLYLILMSIEQWGFFNVPHLMWHRTPVYNAHHLWPVTLSPIAKRLAVELPLPVFKVSLKISW